MGQGILKMIDAGLPSGLPGISDAAAGHPFSHPAPASGVSFSSPGMPGVATPGVKTGPGGMPDILASLGMRGKSG